MNCEPLSKHDACNGCIWSAHRILHVVAHNYWEEFLITGCCLDLHDCTIMGAWLSIVTCRMCNYLQNNYYCEWGWSFYSRCIQKVDPLQAQELHDYHRAHQWRLMITIDHINIYNPWYNIINENRVKHQSLLSREIGSWSRSIITIPSWRYSFLHMVIS